LKCAETSTTRVTRPNSSFWIEADTAMLSSFEDNDAVVVILNEQRII
jgi:hypothetical protein